MAMGIPLLGLRLLGGHNLEYNKLYRALEHNAGII